MISSQLIYRIQKFIGRLIYPYQHVLGLRLCGANVGQNVFIGDNVSFELEHSPQLTIEDEVVIAHHSSLIFHDSSLNNIQGFPVLVGKIILKKNCYLGAHVIVLPGTIVGSNALVGAGSIIKGTLDANTVYVGQPAKPIESVQKLSKKWQAKYPNSLINLHPQPKWYQHASSTASPSPTHKD